MHWLFGAQRLRSQGILGINRRNAACILDRNPRSRLPIVDDKLLMAELCQRVGVPSPAIVGVLSQQGELRSLRGLLDGRNEFVMKPARGSGGRGIIVIVGRDGDHFEKPNGRLIDLDGLRSHASDILCGLFSLNGLPDRALLQQRVRPHKAFLAIAPQGVADIRIILYRFEPAMAMLRLPTLASNGRANLHQGGIGVGLELATGRTHHAVFQNDSIELHPDTGERLSDRLVPHWPEMIAMSRKIARAIGLGFVGIDIVLDEDRGPLVLEANARPGLTIQMADNRGLADAIDEIDRRNAECGTRNAE